jgi:hypothetical protein
MLPLVEERMGGKVTQNETMQVTEKLITFSEFSRQDERPLFLRVSSEMRSLAETGWDGQADGQMFRYYKCSYVITLVLVLIFFKYFYTCIFLN